jgi:hypothetical protein
MRPRALSRGQARRRSATGSIMTGIPGRPVVAGTVASSAVVDAPVRTPATRPAPARFAHMRRRNRHGESGCTLAAVGRPSQIARDCPKRAVRLRHHRIGVGGAGLSSGPLHRWPARPLPADDAGFPRRGAGGVTGTRLSDRHLSVTPPKQAHFTCSISALTTTDISVLVTQGWSRTSKSQGGSHPDPAGRRHCGRDPGRPDPSGR